MSTRAAAGSVVLLTVMAAGAGAQTPNGPLGSRVRVTVRPGSEGAGRQRLVGTLAGMDSNELTLRLADGGTQTLTMEAVRRLEFSRGLKSRKRHAFVGAAVGAAAAVAATATWWALSSDPEKDVGLGFGLLLYAPVAAGLGMSIGLVLPPGERWETAPLPRPGPGARMARSRPIGVGLSVRF